MHTTWEIKQRANSKNSDKKIGPPCQSNTPLLKPSFSKMNLALWL